MKFIRDDEADAVCCAATTRVLAVFDEVVAVVEREFFAACYVAAGDDPDLALIALRVAVWRAAVVDEARGIPVHGPVEVPFVVERENAPVLGLAAQK